MSPLENPFVGALGSVASQAKQVFYVLRLAGGSRPYWPGLGKGFARSLEGKGQHDAPVMRFASVSAAVKEWAKNSHMALDIVRVEAITTPGKSIRVEVPLGDKRQTGVAIQAWKAACDMFYSGQSATMKRWVLLDRAKVYTNLGSAAYALQLAAKEQMGVIAGSPNFVGIAEVTTPDTTTYTETVLA